MAWTGLASAVQKLAAMLNSLSALRVVVKDQKTEKSPEKLEF
jgi:hypothetical protein